MHATNQVITFKVPQIWKETKKLKNILNKSLPRSIIVKTITIVDNSFHPRFDAKSREYRYIISKKINPFIQAYTTYHPYFECQKIKHIMKNFEGTHDFKYFKKNGSDNKSDIRTILKSDCYQHKDLTIIRFRANSFLRSQVRLMVAFLIELHDDKLTQANLQEQLDKKRVYLTKPAPANGLYLTKIRY